MIIQAHFVRQFLRSFAMIGCGLPLVTATLGLIKRSDSISQSGPAELAMYVALSFPKQFIVFMPVAALMCSLFVVAQASRAGELVAVMSAGGRLRRLFMPLVLCGVLLSALSFLMGEFVAPKCSQRLAEDYLGEGPEVRSKDGITWVRAEDGSMVRMGMFMEDGSVRDISIYWLDGERLRGVVTAGSARYAIEEKSWVLEGARAYDLGTGAFSNTGDFRYAHLSPPGEIRSRKQSPFDMGLVELHRYIRKMREAGFKNPELSIGFHTRISGNLINLVMVVIGLSVASMRRFGGLLATGIGLLITALYWMAYTLSQSMGYAGILPPVASAWVTPAIFSALAVYLFLKVPE